MFSIKWQARIVRSDIPSCSSFNARKMISYIHARISENQSNIEILIHDNSTPFLLRDTRAFLPDLCSTNEYLKGKKRGGHSPATHHRSLPNDPNFTVHALSFLFFHEILLLIKSTRSDIIDSRQFSLHQFESNSIDRSPLFHAASFTESLNSNINNELNTRKLKKINLASPSSVYFTFDCTTQPNISLQTDEICLHRSDEGEKEEKNTVENVKRNDPSVPSPMFPFFLPQL